MLKGVNMIKFVLAAFDSFVFSVLDFLLFLAICLFVILLGYFFWPLLKLPILIGAILAITYFCYQLYKLRVEQKRIEQDKTTKLAEWSKQELQRPIIQQLLKKQEESKSFIPGTIISSSNRNKETMLTNISVSIKNKARYGK